MLQTVTDNLREMATEIRNLLKDFLLVHSSLYRWHPPEDQSVIGIPAHGDYAYEELGDVGLQLQARLLEEYRRYYALLSLLLKEQPQDTLKDLAKSNTVLQRTIEQQKTPCKTIEEALTRVDKALQFQINLLERLDDTSNGELTYIPDTNALLYNTRLETWSFTDAPKFILILLPTILEELDLLKINHRNEAVREKAETLIRQIKEYRRRGQLTTGVPLVAGTVTLLAVALEPMSGAFLPWHDPDNNDDRFLASTLEVMRMRPKSPVILVSRDINLQNKAEFARIPYTEPPSPV